MKGVKMMIADFLSSIEKRHFLTIEKYIPFSSQPMHASTLLEQFSGSSFFFFSQDATTHSSSCSFCFRPYVGIQDMKTTTGKGFDKNISMVAW
jgi:hypothetical protein